MYINDFPNERKKKHFFFGLKHFKVIYSSLTKMCNKNSNVTDKLQLSGINAYIFNLRYRIRVNTVKETHRERVKLNIYVRMF